MMACYLVGGRAMRLDSWRVSPGNPALLEARAWMNGRLDIEQRVLDTAAPPDGRIYNVYPPLMTAICFAALQIGSLQGWPAGEVYAPWVVLIVGLPLPLAAYWAFRQVQSKVWAAVMAIALICGTPLLHCMNRMPIERGAVNFANHILSSVGLLLIAGDLLGKKRIYPAIIGLCIATWTRQFTLLFAIPILAASWQTSRSFKLAVSGVFIAVAPLVLLNCLKFGSPFESGYRHIYVGAENTLYGRRVQEHGLFSLNYVPDNAYAMNVAPPEVRDTPLGIMPVPTLTGVSIWLTMPLLWGLFVFRWWPDRDARWLMLSSLPIILGHLTYHNSGYPEIGYRFALDYLPVWFMVVARFTRLGHWAVLAIVWSLYYFKAATELVEP